MKYATITLTAAVVALTLSGGAYAQNNTLATPTVKSPAAATSGYDTSGYGTPGTSESDSGAWSPNSGQSNRTNNGSTVVTPAYGGNNTLARPTVKSPAAPQ